MAGAPTTITDEIGLTLGNLADAATGLTTPVLRLGVTGLSRAGKSVFITALIHNLLTNARLPGFQAQAEGRLIGVKLAEHPEQGIPRFAYEQHLRALTGNPADWPESTRRISQIRLTLKFQSAKWPATWLGPSQIHLDIVDYPGEWLLDLPLLSLSYQEWSAQALTRLNAASDLKQAKSFLKLASAASPAAPGNETQAEKLASTFTTYLRACREDNQSLSALPPGRFLMPGDLEGSPALTFAPLPEPGILPDQASLHAMFERRYEAYKDVVVRPFFRDHFARLDRQIVLVDALRALNTGAAAITDLESALTDILQCFRQGANSPLSRLIARRIDRILFAATKADHLHHTTHPRLEAIMKRLVAGASRRVQFAGAQTQSIAMAAIRATSEVEIEEDGKPLDLIVGTPQKGETLHDDIYDGKTEIALFPGTLPEEPESVFQPDFAAGSLKFLRFNPPSPLQHNNNGDPILPSMRLDRAIDFLIGDWLA